MASSGQSSELPHLVSLIKTLTIPQLKDLLRNEGLPVSGLKASLQLRIIDYLERLCNSEGNHIRYDALRRRILQTGLPGTAMFQANLNQPFQASSASQPSSSHPRSTSLGNSMSPHAFSPSPITFKESPFYEVVKPLTSVVECKVREQTRDSVDLKIYLDQTTAADLQANPNLRVMIYCAADSNLKQYTKSDIAFPHQVELKANLDEVKANLRGLKNKPGTTQPADVTNYIRKKANYPNTIVVTYALTQKKFFVLANLVREYPVKELLAQLQSRKILKEQVIREMKNRAEDTDIVATSTIMSLKCPLSTLRIQVPCRSAVCTHNQCFDASSFLELQKQAPTWTCPVCSKSTLFDSLQVDQYVDDILQSTSPDADQVVIEPNGVWSSPSDAATVNLGGVTPTTDDDDDLVELSEPGVSSVKQEPISLPAGIMLERTPAQSRETSTPSSAVRLSSRKRSAPTPVVDLTGSDDEDASPLPPTKRPTLNFIGRGIPSHDSHQPVTSSPLNSRSYSPSY
ncbi:uncharacterized protein N7459_009789 [Penicillium hispanicum]|uniref:uncharacterized protein n=1 Tax=Penicillium hispanicum TaxID=1080232 RepID=UPI002540F889|nr:uncharacterized protein N7459_009789 [Penicillium hispanicum]KAJ5570359.1 hypothetical protein N7459_009789 [Penicillium hispanicum]